MVWYPSGRDPQRQRGFDLIGDAIFRRRKSLGLTQRYLGSLANIDQSVISRIENGRQYGLHWKRFADLVEALGGLDTTVRRAKPPGPDEKAGA